MKKIITTITAVPFGKGFLNDSSFRSGFSIVLSLCSVLAYQVIYGQGSLPLQNGFAVVTCFSGLDGNTGPNPSGFVMAVMDIRDPQGNAAPAAPANWYTPATGAYHHPSWTASVMGEVFGVDLGEGASPDIYVTSSGTLPVLGLNVPPGTGGNGGDVYRINGTSGAVTRIASLPNHIFNATQSGGGTGDYYVGLGQVSWNDLHDVLYVSNFDDGLIYVLNSSGTQLGTFDHGASLAVPVNDDPALLYTQLNRMVYAVEYNSFDGRLYYALHANSDLATGNNEIWSVALNANGTINAASKTLEYSYAASNVMPADIQFDGATGTTMLFAEQSFQLYALTLNSATPSAGITIGGTILANGKAAHLGKAFRLTESAGTWSLATTYAMGVSPRGTMNSAGVLTSGKTTTALILMHQAFVMTQ